MCLSLTHHPCSALRAWNRLHSSKIHKTLIMQKCPNLDQQELKYQEFLYPVGKKANTSLRVSLFLNSFKPPSTLHLYAWTHICAPPFSMLFPHGKKNLFVILEGIAVGGLMKSVVFILSLEKVWHCLQQLIVRICTRVTKRSVLLSRTSRIHPCPTLVGLIFTQ